MLQKFLSIVSIYEIFDSFNPELSDDEVNIPCPRNIKHCQKFLTQKYRMDTPICLISECSPWELLHDMSFGSIR